MFDDKIHSIIGAGISLHLPSFQPLPARAKAAIHNHRNELVLSGEHKYLLKTAVNRN